MGARGVLLTDLFLSLCALAGLVALHAALLPRRREPLARRFIFGLRVTMALFAGRALFALTGWWVARVLTLAAAALIPLAVLLLTEALLRRHAPAWVKGFAAGGATFFGILALAPASDVADWRLGGLLGFQVGALALCGWLVRTRDRDGLSSAENRAVVRLGLSLLLLVPLGAADFLMVQIGLPVQVSGLAVLVLCWLAVSLGREEGTFGLAAGILAALAAAAVLAAAWDLDGQGTLLTAAVLLAATLAAQVAIDARALRQGDPDSLLRLLAEGRDDSEGFLDDLRAQPLVAVAAELGPQDLPDLDPGTLARLFAQAPVRRRADPLPEGEEGEHLAHLLDLTGASHLLLARREPLRLLALDLPALAGSPRAELEIGAVQRMALALAERREVTVDKAGERQDG